MTIPLSDRIRVLDPSPDVTERARYLVHALTARVHLSLEKILLDDTYARQPIPASVDLPVIRLTIGNEGPFRNVGPPTTEPIHVIVRVSGKGYGELTEEIDVPPLKPGEFIGRVFPTGFKKLEIVDWWLARLPEQRST
jgi:hypothetical protein